MKKIIIITVTALFLMAGTPMAKEKNAAQLQKARATGYVLIKQAEVVLAQFKELQKKLKANQAEIKKLSE